MRVESSQIETKIKWKGQKVEVQSPSILLSNCRQSSFLLLNQL